MARLKARDLSDARMKYITNQQELSVELKSLRFLKTFAVEKKPKEPKHKKKRIIREKFNIFDFDGNLLYSECKLLKNGSFYFMRENEITFKMSGISGLHDNGFKALGKYLFVKCTAKPKECSTSEMKPVKRKRRPKFECDKIKEYELKDSERSKVDKTKVSSFIDKLKKNMDNIAAS